MSLAIENGIESIVEMSKELSSGKKVLYIYYDEQSKTVRGSFKHDAQGDKEICVLCREVDENQLRSIVETGYRAVMLEDKMPIPCDETKYTSQFLKQEYERRGFDKKYYKDFIMAAYLWQVYNRRHIDLKEKGDVAVYINLSGNTYCHDNVPHDKMWLLDMIIRDNEAFFALYLPKAFASCSLFTIANALLVAYDSKKAVLNAMDTQNK